MENLADISEPQEKRSINTIFHPFIQFQCEKTQKSII